MEVKPIVSFTTVADETPDGLRVDLMTTDFGLEELHLIVSQKVIERALEVFPGFEIPEAPIVLASYEEDSRTLKTFPIKTGFNQEFLKPKYSKLRSITVEDVYAPSDHEPGQSYNLVDLPSGFVRDPRFGFGLNYDIRLIALSIEKIVGVSELLISKQKGLSKDGNTLRMSRGVFGKICTTMGRMHRSTLAFANSRKSDYIDLTLTAMLDPKHEADEDARDIASDLGELLAQKLVGKSKTEDMARRSAVKRVRSSVKTIAEKEPEELVELRREIETVTLEELIERMEKKISQKSLTEHDWQVFLTNNSFVLGLAFGVPAVVFEEQVSVGGTKLDGSGGKLADYVVKAGLFGNLAIIEIKTPFADLVDKKAYRGELHAPTRELAGAVNQVLDQRYRLQMEIKSKKIDFRVYDVYTYAVQCLVIAGTIPESEPERKSLELFRNNLRDVMIITFDELLAKLKALLAFFKEPPKAADPHRADLF